MREIEFRGLRLDGKEWIYGYYFLTQTGEAVMLQSDYRSLDGIFPVQVTRVREDTIGQFTGLTDKFGVRIFEGDIVETLYDGLQAISYSHAGFGYPDGKVFVFISSFVNQTEVIGNIHQNPELLAQ